MWPVRETCSTSIGGKKRKAIYESLGNRRKGQLGCDAKNQLTSAELGAVGEIIQEMDITDAGREKGVGGGDTGHVVHCAALHRKCNGG